MIKNQHTQVQIVPASDLGDLLGVRAATIRRWAKAGKIPVIQLPNGRMVFDLWEVTHALKHSPGQGRDVDQAGDSHEGPAS